jgi:hypothetical protein
VPVRVELGHNQTLRVNDTALQGVREVDVEMSTRTIDITGWNHKYASTLPTVIDASLTVTLYYPNEVGQFWTNLRTHPKEPMTLQIDGLVRGPFVVSGIKIGCPMGGVVPHEVTFKQYCYQ